MASCYTAAYAQTDITPDYPVDLVGFGRADSMSRGVLTPLLAQALLLRGDGAAYCLITIDNIGLSVADARALRDAIAHRLGTTRERVMLFCSHSHATPNTDEHAPNGARYMAELTDKVLACVASIENKGHRAEAGWGLTRAAIGANRRAGGTACDDRVGVLKIVDAETAEPIATLLRVTAHANVLRENNLLVSSDYFGAARDVLSPLLGSPVMLTQGAAGNIRPKYQGDRADLQTTAAVLRNAISGMTPIQTAPLQAVGMHTVTRQYASDVPSAAEAARIADNALRECGIDGAAWIAECVALRDRGVTEQMADIEVSFCRIGEGMLCGIPHEAFTEAAIEVQARTSPLVFFGGYTNGFSGYLPTREEWRKGGYETLYSYLQFYPYFGRVMPLREDTLGNIVDFAAKEWHKGQ